MDLYRRIVGPLLVALAVLVGPVPAADAEVATDRADAPVSIDVRRVTYRYTADGLSARIAFADLREVRRSSFGVHLYQSNPNDISSNQAVYLRVTPGGRLQRRYLNVGEEDTSALQCAGMRATMKPGRDVVRFWLPRACLDTAYPRAFGDRVEVGVASALYSRDAWSRNVNYLREPNPLWGEKGRATKADLVAGTDVAR